MEIAHPRDIIVIGGSAGGLDALLQVLWQPPMGLGDDPLARGTPPRDIREERRAAAHGPNLRRASRSPPPDRERAAKYIVEREGANAAVSVRDTGIGMLPDALEHVFDLFQIFRRVKG
jgi:hypothetical protein